MNQKPEQSLFKEKSQVVQEDKQNLISADKSVQQIKNNEYFVPGKTSNKDLTPYWPVKAVPRGEPV